MCHAEDRGFAPRPGLTKDHHKNGTNCLPAWHEGIRVVCGTPSGDMYCQGLYPGPRFLQISSATC